MGRVVRSLKHGWNIWKAPPNVTGFSAGPMTNSRPNRSPGRYYSDKSIVGSIYNRLAIDFASIEFFHAMLDKENDVAVKVVRDSFNECLMLNPNVDQTAFAMKMDLAYTLFESGHAAVVPTDADLDPAVSASYDIRDMRVATVAGWHPRRVTLNLYDDREHDEDGNPVGGGVTRQIVMEKQHVALIENPFYSVMNEPSSTLQRLKNKLSLIDGLDSAVSSGKLDLIMQLPYSVRGESRKAQAEKRRQDLRDQMKDDELGIGYIDVSEKVIQLNRPIDNKQLEALKELQDGVYAELGLTREIMNGTANRDTINNYFDRTIEPIATAVSTEYKRKFLTKTARTQRHSIEIYRDPLKVIPLDQLAEVTDKVMRSSVVSANEFRPKLGLMPSSQPGANLLHNPNMPIDKQPNGNNETPPEEVDNV